MAERVADDRNVGRETGRQVGGSGEIDGISAVPVPVVLPHRKDLEAFIDDGVGMDGSMGAAPDGIRPPAPSGPR